MTDTSILALNVDHVAVSSDDQEQAAHYGVQPTRPASDQKFDETSFWYSYVTERAAAKFLDLTERTMQAMRQRGGGPRYFAISSRCLRYRRVDLKAWVDQRLRTSTSDDGQSGQEDSET